MPTAPACAGWRCAAIAAAGRSRQIAFATDFSLHILDVASGADRTLAVPSRSLAWSPDGARIAFGYGHELYTVRADGSHETPLTAVDSDVQNPSWSPDGTTLVFDGGYGIYSVGADGTGPRLLVSGVLGNGPGTPSWSPDGRRILYFNTPLVAGGYAAEVWVMRPDGSHRRRLFHTGCCIGVWSPPLWSPDGKKIAINDDGVLVMDVNGRHRHRAFRLTDLVAWQPRPLTR
jgi:Tol biopolymer transport system component